MNASFLLYAYYSYFRFIENLFYQNFRFTDYYFTSQQHSKKILTYIVSLISDSINKLSITVKWVTQNFWLPSVQKVYLHCLVVMIKQLNNNNNKAFLSRKHFVHPWKAVPHPFNFYHEIAAIQSHLQAPLVASSFHLLYF